MTLPTDQQQRYIEIWAKAVDTQMHFNEMSVKSRQLGLTFVAAVLGLAVVLVSRGDDFAVSIPREMPYLQIHVSVVLALGASLALLAVRTLDLNVYHRMLRGSVTFGEDFEEHYMKQIFLLEKGMTQAISHYSRYKDATVKKEEDATVKKETEGSRKYHYSGNQEVTAEDKIKRFYRWGFSFLAGTAVALFILTNINLWLGERSGLNQETTAPVVSSEIAEEPSEGPRAPGVRNAGQ